MNERPHTDEFLTAVTSGLKGDRELQLDVQAELRSHIEEYRREAEGNGATPDAAAEQAVQAMGPIADVAAGLEQANRRRMRLRALVRLAAQWLLAPLAVAVAVLTTDWGGFLAVRGLSNDFAIDVPFVDHSPSLFRHRTLTSDERLVLKGDETKPTQLARQKAIWDRWPENKVYLHNYVTHLQTESSFQGPTPDQASAALDAELARLQARDPDNARFDYLRAGLLLKQAVEDKQCEVKDADGKIKIEYETLIKDRAALDQAMALFKAGLKKPEFRRYTREMAVEQLAILGQPTSLGERVAQVGLLAGLLLPDIAHLRNLERKAIFYGELLAGEGRREEADVFLRAHLRFAPQINNDAFVLIDVLVVSAIAGYGDRAAGVYEKLGDKAAAERFRAESAPLAAPVKQWKEQWMQAVKSSAEDWENTLKRQGSIMAGMLLPTLGEGEYPAPDQLKPGRMVEYVVAEGMALIILSVALFVVMFLAALAAIYYRWIRAGRIASILLLPESGELARLLAVGVLLPLLGYYLVTRWWPWAAREEMNVGLGIVPFVMQLHAVLFAMIGLTLVLARRRVRRRCRQLQLPVPPPSHRLWALAGWGLVVLLTLPGLWPGHVWVSLWAREACSWVCGAVVLALVLGSLGYAISRDVRFGRSCAAYYGSLMRTVIPVIALALILVNLCSRPYLRHAERRWLAQDTVTALDSSGGGLTVIESRLTQRLKAEIQQAAGKTP